MNRVSIQNEEDEPINEVQVEFLEKRTWTATMKEFLRIFGPGVIISVGMVDPGNWESNIQAGAVYGYRLLWVVLLSNFLAIILQTLSVRLGLVTSHDLAQLCRIYYHPLVAFILWILAEIAMIATDLSEVLGTAIALYLLTGGYIPMIWGCLITGLDTFIFLFFELLGHKIMELFVFGLMSIISICFLVETIFSKPNVADVLHGSFIPSLPPGSLSVATGIVGSVIMPHNLYLHSGIVTAKSSKNHAQTRRFCYYAFFDGLICLTLATLVNCSILVVSSAAFYEKPYGPAEGKSWIAESYRLLETVFGKASQVMFGIALLAAGQSSTITGTMAGQFVMEGFINVRLKSWIRRLITRSAAIIPAVVILAATGTKGADSPIAGDLLLWSQIVLSIQLPFACIPLIRFTSHDMMGKFKNGVVVQIISWIAVLIVIGLNVWLVVDSAMDLGVGKLSSESPALYAWLMGLSAILAFIILVFTVYITIGPLKKRNSEALNAFSRLEKYLVSRFWVLRFFFDSKSIEEDTKELISDDLNTEEPVYV